MAEYRGGESVDRRLRPIAGPAPDCQQESLSADRAVALHAALRVSSRSLARLVQAGRPDHAAALEELADRRFPRAAPGGPRRSGRRTIFLGPRAARRRDRQAATAVRRPPRAWRGLLSELPALRGSKGQGQAVPPMDRFGDPQEPVRL